MEIWKKFYECSCGSEGIMTSYEDEGEVYLAFFNNGFNGKQLGFKGKLRFCWQILRKGFPWTDCVVLDKKVAKELGQDLLKWGEK